MRKGSLNQLNLLSITFMIDQIRSTRIISMLFVPTIPSSLRARIYSFSSQYVFNSLSSRMIQLVQQPPPIRDVTERPSRIERRVAQLSLAPFENTPRLLDPGNTFELLPVCQYHNCVLPVTIAVRGLALIQCIYCSIAPRQVTKARSQGTIPEDE